MGFSLKEIKLRVLVNWSLCCYSFWCWNDF